MRPVMHVDRARARASKAALLLLAGSFAIHVNGCSVLLPLVASTQKQGRPPMKPTDARGSFTINFGDSLVLHHYGGGRTRGYYLGMKDRAYDDYREAYAQWLATDPRPDGVPLLGDSVHVRLQLVNHLWSSEGRFLGFEHNGIVVQHADGTEERHPLTQVMDCTFPQVSGASVFLDRRELWELRSAGQLPLLTNVEVRTMAGVVEVPIDQVETIELPSKGSKIFAAFLVGVVLDIAAITYVSSEIKRSEAACGKAFGEALGGASSR